MKVWHTRWSKTPLDTFKLDLGEGFWVGGTEKHYLFVTQSGQLHGARTMVDETKTVERAWTSSSQPIEALITDADSNRTFAFTKPNRTEKIDGKPLYFELGPEPKTEFYDRDALMKDCKDDPARVYALARFLVEQKKIVIKK